MLIRRTDFENRIQFGNDIRQVDELNYIFKNSLAGTFIKTISWICPFLYMNSTLMSILHGLGMVNQSFLLNLCSSILRILFVLLVIPAVGIRGYLYGLLISQLFVSLAALGLLYFQMTQNHRKYVR